MKHLTENAEEKIKEMDFCLLEGDDDKYGVRTIDEVKAGYYRGFAGVRKTKGYGMGKEKQGAR